ncbi:RimK family alpha-L-glutamate ligase [Oceaniradius stylonematis]|uniref:RimK family alpha-L-glutamate ligase n=1 Tax=Oceaniradius stylonematis TaxID=2184161 RepID=UPI00273E2146|nr:RimK family alpha-L-glutamate ligase [Oceaniradius stylonematis]
MNIAMLTNRNGHHTQNRLKQTAERRGHELHAINPLRCTMDISENGLRLWHEGRPLTNYDAVIPLLTPSTAEFGMAVLRQLECMGVISLNPSAAVARARDKLLSLQLLAQSGVPVPTTALAHERARAEQMVELVGGAPTVVKLPQGRQGIGVVLAESMQSARSVIEAFRSTRQYVLVQRFIKEAAGNDIRVITIDGEVVATMRRTGQPGEFRSNLHRGGDPKPVAITLAEHALALQATRAVGLSVSGVDILRSKNGPLVIEINSTPGLKGTEQVSGQDVAGKMIDFLESRLKQRRAEVPKLRTMAA